MVGVIIKESLLYYSLNDDNPYYLPTYDIPTISYYSLLYDNTIQCTEELSSVYRH